MRNFLTYFILAVCLVCDCGAHMHPRARLRAHFQQLDERNAAHEQRFGELYGLNNAYRQELDGLKAHLQQLYNQNVAHDQKFGELDRLNNAYRQELDGLKAHLQQLDDRKAAHDQSLCELKNQFADQITQLSTQNADQMNQYNQKFEDLQTSLDRYNISIGILRDQYGREHNALLERVNRQDSEITALQKLLAQEREKFKETFETLTKFSEGLQQCNQEIKGLQEQLSEVKAKSSYMENNLRDQLLEQDKRRRDQLLEQYKDKIVREFGTTLSTYNSEIMEELDDRFQYVYVDVKVVLISALGKSGERILSILQNALHNHSVDQESMLRLAGDALTKFNNRVIDTLDECLKKQWEDHQFAAERIENGKKPFTTALEEYKGKVLGSLKKVLDESSLQEISKLDEDALKKILHGASN